MIAPRAIRERRGAHASGPGSTPAGVVLFSAAARSAAMFWTAPASLEQFLAATLLTGDDVFGSPLGEAGLVGPDSISWRVFRNPVTMYVGGVAAVLLELAEPRVGHAVWANSDFRRRPARRLQRTGHAAMVTVYAPRSAFSSLAGRVNAMHARVVGATPAGEAYAANDPALLRWVQATAAWAFVEAYRRWARPLSPASVDRYLVEGAAGAAMYGVTDPPADAAALRALFAEVAPRLGPSPIVAELLAILRTAPMLPGPLRPLQATLAAAAVELLPSDLRARLGLGRERRLTPPERLALAAMAGAAERTHWRAAPYAKASRRLGLPEDYLLRAPVSRPAAARPRS